MIARYRVLAERLRAELPALARVVDQATGAIERAAQQPQNKEYFIAAAAFELHSFYAGVERLLELIANDVDGGRPATQRWHRDLLAQMSLEVTGLRPAVLAPETRAALLEYLEFRHVVRNVYTFDLRAARVAELVQGAPHAFDLAQRDFLAFTRFLDGLATADEEESRH